MKELKARDLMTEKVVTLKVNEDINLAENVMRLGRIRHLPVVNDKGHLVGLVTHRDLLKAQVSTLADLSDDERSSISRAVPAEKIMTRDVLTVTPDAPVLDVARAMREHKFGCIPVVQGEQLAGIITEADFMDLVIRALEEED